MRHLRNSTLWGKQGKKTVSSAWYAKDCCWSFYECFQLLRFNSSWPRKNSLLRVFDLGKSEISKLNALLLQHFRQRGAILEIHSGLCRQLFFYKGFVIQTKDCSRILDESQKRASPSSPPQLPMQGTHFIRCMPVCSKTAQSRASFWTTTAGPSENRKST